MQQKQLHLMRVLELTEHVMCSKYNYDWEDSMLAEIKSEYIEEYNKYFLFFWNLIHSTNYTIKNEINYK